MSRPSTGTGTSADTVPTNTVPTNTVPTDTVSTPRTGAATRPGSPPRGESAARPAPTAADPAIRRGPAFPAAPPVNRMRRARLKIANVDPWSVMKVSFLFSVAIAVMGLVAVTLLWALLDMMGVFSTVGNTIDDVTGGPASGGFDVQAFFSLSRVLGFTTIIALVDIVLLTALATVGAYLYNVTTDFVGGIEITLAEEE